MTNGILTVAAFYALVAAWRALAAWADKSGWWDRAEPRGFRFWIALIVWLSLSAGITWGAVLASVWYLPFPFQFLGVVPLLLSARYDCGQNWSESIVVSIVAAFLMAILIVAWSFVG